MKEDRTFTEWVGYVAGEAMALIITLAAIITFAWVTAGGLLR